MGKTIGSFDLASLKNLRDDVTQYFWFESDSSSAWGSGAHVTLYPESQFTDSTSPNYMKGQNIIMNTDGFSIRNGALPMMVLDNNSLDFNAVDTSLGTYTTMATFGLTGATIGQTSGAHSVIDANGQRFYASDGITQLANIGYGPGTDSGGGTSNAPYYTLGTRVGTVGNYSIAEGYGTTASGYASHAEGEQTEATLRASHAEGYSTKAYAPYSHAEGSNTIAGGGASPNNGIGAHAEGFNSVASGNYSHAENGGADYSYRTEASGIYSHAEGYSTRATGKNSHTEGNFTVALGDNSHTQNIGTRAESDNQTALGAFNIADNADTYAVIIGNGTASDARSNALTVDWSGNVEASGSITDGNGNTIPVYDGGYESMGSINTNSYADKSVSFVSTFSTAPNVVACLSTSGTAGNIGNVSVSVFNVTTTGCTIRVFNNRGSSLSPAVEWIAIGKS